MVGPQLNKGADMFNQSANAQGRGWEFQIFQYRQFLYNHYIMQENQETQNKVIIEESEIKPSLSPDHSEDDEFVVIDYQVEEEPLTQFPPEDQFPQTTQIKVIDYIYEKTYVLLSTETFILKIIYKHNHSDTQQSRTLSDFYWLRNTIQVKYPGIAIPIFTIPQSAQNIVKQKMIVVQQFINYLTAHQILKNSPEVKAFFSQKIKYLQARKEIQSSFKLPKIHYSSFQLSSILSLLKPWKKTKQNTSTARLDIPNIKQLVEKEKYFQSTIHHLNKLMQCSKRSKFLSEQVIQQEEKIFSKHFIDESFQNVQQRLKKLFKENRETRVNAQSLQYLQLGIKTQIVKQNLSFYLQWFQIIRKLQDSILSLKQKNDYQSAVIEQKYLRLLVNNMNRDISTWIQYNNNLIQDALIDL